jgi:hypothetical protein
MATTAPQVQRYYVSRAGFVASAMFDADQGEFFGTLPLFDTLDEAQAYFEYLQEED